MTSLRATGALTLLLLAPSFAPAAWNNVFQVTCCGGGRRTAAFAPAPCTSCAPPCTSCAPPCPAPCPTTAFVQRSFYQPVQSMQAVSFFEPVTTTRTSFFFEPVTSYSVSNFVDPCTGCCQQVATPVTSFRMRQQCNSCVNWVQRTGFRPVTTFRQSFYWEQVQVPSCPAPACAPAVVAAPAAPCTTPPLNLGGSAPPPAATAEQQGSPSPALGESRDQYYMPPANPSRLRTPPTASQIKIDRIASLGGAPVVGQVVTAGHTPRGGAQVVFVNASRQDVRQSVTADTNGNYQANLPAGAWYVYVDRAYHNQIDVKASEPRQITLVSR